MRIRFRRPAAASLTGALLVIVAACAVETTPHWADAGIHVVDEHWIPVERPCDLTSADACVIAVRAAEAGLLIDPRTVTGAATAGLPTKWVRADGQEVIVIPSYSGAPPEFVILDLVGGVRRTTGYACWGVPKEDGTMNCGVFPLNEFHVGASPLD